MLPFQAFETFTTTSVFCYEAYAFVSHKYEDWYRTIIRAEYSIKFRPLLCSKRVQIKVRSCKLLTRFELEDLILKSSPKPAALYMGSLTIQAVRRFTKHPRGPGLWRFWQMEYAVNDSAIPETTEERCITDYDSTVDTNILIGLYDASLFKSKSDPPLPRAWNFKKSTLEHILEKLHLEKKSNLPYSCHEEKEPKTTTSTKNLIGDWSEYCGLSVNMEDYYSDSNNSLVDSRSRADILESGPSTRQRKLQNTHFNASAESICSWEETTKYYATIDAKLYRTPWETISLLEDMGYRVTRIYPQTQKQYVAKLNNISNPKLTATLQRELEELKYLIDFSAKIPKEFR